MFDASDAFSSFSVDDLEKAHEFYGGVLGLRVVKEGMGFLTVHLAGGNRTVIYPKPDHTPASFTILSFPVSDIEEAVDRLTQRGVRLESYEGPDVKTDARGIASDGEGPKVAWFSDPAGNILSVLEE